MFLAGYKTAQQQFGIPLTEQESNFYREFQPWLQHRLGMTTSRSWAKMLEFRSINQQEVFETFFRLLDEFCDELLREGEPISATKSSNSESEQKRAS
jgi:hypothetical protein